MGVDVGRINAITFGIGALMAGAAGALLSIIYPISPLNCVAVSRQGLRRLRARRPWQRTRRAGRRSRARHRRELRLVLVRTGARDDDLVRAPAAAPVCASQRPPRQAGLRMRNWIDLGSRRRSCSLRCPLAGNNYLLRLATIVCMYAVLGAVVELHRRADGLSVVRHRRLLRPGRLHVRRAAKSRSADDRGLGLRRPRRDSCSRRSSAARSCICAAITSRSRAWLSPRCCVRSSTPRPISPAAAWGSTCRSCASRSARRRSSSFYAMLALAVAAHRDGDRGAAQQARLRTALHPAERGRRQHARRQRLRLQDRRVHRCPPCSSALPARSTPPGSNYIEPPDVFDILLAVKPLVMVLLGGLGTIFGPAIGAVDLARVRGSGVAQFPDRARRGART